MNSGEFNAVASLSELHQPVTLYAEYLLNIKTVTIFAILPTESSPSTEARLAHDSDQFTVRHDGTKVSLQLPARVKGVSNHPHDVNLARECGQTKELRFRFQIEDGAAGRDKQENGMHREVDVSANVVPWSASEWKAGWSMCCNQCNATIISKEQLQTFKDLPSENWAEMMDFWHCHKPHNEEQANDVSENDVAALKGYSASSRLWARSGTLFVEQSYFLVSADDCQSIEIPVTDKNAYIRCAKCRAVLGHEDSQADGLRLFKWSLTLFSAQTQQSVHVDEELWVASYLLSKAEDSASRKVVVHNGEDESADALMIWIFTPDMRYSSSVAPNLQDRRAMKVLWQLRSIIASSNTTKTTATTPAVGGGGISDDSTHRVDLPSAVFKRLVKGLQASQTLLPRSARRMFQDAWHVSLLHRFSQRDFDLAILSL